MGLFVALLDANVIWSAAVRDTLLLAAEHRLYRPVWTLEILDEMTRNLKLRRPDLNPARLDRTARLMVEHFPDALVTGYEALVSAMTNHEGDRHVLAAAVRGGAQVIVTWNGDHFPSSASDPYAIEVQTPDEFLCHLWHLAPENMAQVLREQAEHLISPPQTPGQVVATLSKSVPAFSEIAFSSGLLDPSA